MIGAGWPVPDGCVAEFLDSVDSTCSRALERARAGERNRLWLVAKRQTAGRGRHGRDWQSPPGNLYATRLVVSRVEMRRLAELGFVAGLAAYDAVRRLLVDASASGLVIKWPNDLVVHGAKLSGVLIEVEPVGEEIAAAVGIGLNVLKTPADRPTTSLAELGASVSAVQVFSALGEAFERWFAVWNEGAGFSEIRDSWLARSVQPGEPISVRLGRRLVEGRFAGIDDSGALLVVTEAGITRRIAAGDVLMAGEAR